MGVLAILLAHKILSCLLGSQKEKLSAQKHYNTPKRHGINNIWVIQIDGTADLGNDLLNFSKLPIFLKIVCANLEKSLVYIWATIDLFKLC